MAIGPVAIGIASDVQGTFVPALYVFVGLLAVSGVTAALIATTSRRSAGDIEVRMADTAD
jgi:hypothetical protein